MRALFVINSIRYPDGKIVLYINSGTFSWLLYANVSLSYAICLCGVKQFPSGILYTSLERVD